MKRDEVLILGTQWMTLDNTVLRKKSGPKSYVLYDSILMKYPELANL